MIEESSSETITRSLASIDTFRNKNEISTTFKTDHLELSVEDKTQIFNISKSYIHLIFTCLTQSYICAMSIG